MEKKKLKLDALKVQSFVTCLEEKEKGTLQGEARAITIIGERCPEEPKTTKPKTGIDDPPAIPNTIEITKYRDQYGHCISLHNPNNGYCILRKQYNEDPV